MRVVGLPLLALLALGGPAAAAPPRSPDVVAGAWIEEREGGPALVVALHRRAGTQGPAKAFVGCSVGTDEDLPGGYGSIPTDGWTETTLEAGTLTLAERALRPEERERPPSVLVTTAAAATPLAVHPLILGEVPAGTLLFARPHRAATVTVASHVLEIGRSTELELAAPPADFFLAETLEVAVASRRLGLDGAEAEGDAGHVRVQWLAPEGAPPAPAQELRGEAGEERIRAHFTDPKCAWAERHVAWTSSRWVIEYVRATPLRFRLETDAVKRPGLVSGTWQGYGALAVEAIYPNGFGGSSTNFDLPPILVIPPGTPTRRLALR